MHQFIGHSIPIRDGDEKVTGRTKYAPDIKLAGMLHTRLVTSPHAHALINSIDSSEALALEGVTAVLTAQDLPDIPPNARNRLLLARGRVIFAGQPVALVLAETPEAAQDAIDMVWVDYDPQPAALTIDEAIADNAPLVWPSGKPGESGEAAAHGADVGGGGGSQKPSNKGRDITFAQGEIATGLEQADEIIELTFTTPMVHQGYLETMSYIAQPDPYTGGATLYASTQAPFYARQAVAEVLDVPETAVRVIPTTAGGAFGAKFMLYELLVALAAKTVQRPVRFVLTRTEDMIATNPAPASRIRVKLGGKKDGSLTALQADMLFDTGCYPNTTAIAAVLMGSQYQIPHQQLTYNDVTTFKMSTAAYRAPGAPQATFALESALDQLAEKLDIDPLDIRLKNASKEGDTMIHGRPWSTMGLTEVLQAMQAHPAWQKRTTRAEAHKKYGIGVAVGGWPGGIEPTAASCQLHRDGTLQVHVGSVDLTGTPTGLAIIAAEAFGINPDKVHVTVGDTSTASFAGATGGSKITYMVGPSVIKAAEDAKQQTLEIAAEEFEAAIDDLEIVEESVQVRGVPDKKLSLRDIASKTMRFGGKHAPVQGNGRHANTTPSPGFAAQLAEVSIDEETGELTVERLLVVQDVGRAINPMVMHGQLMGGATQGLGWALYEGIVHDSSGQPLTGSWMDYNIPHFTQSAMHLETVAVEVPSPHGPFGARGVGEPPIIATAPAVANAIYNATGVRLTDLPMTAPRILSALHEASQLA